MEVNYKMVVPLLAWGLIAGAGAVATYFIADAGGSDSEQVSKTEQVSKNETKQSTESKSVVNTTTNNSSSNVYNFQKSNITDSSLGLSSTTSPKVDSKSTPTQSQTSNTSPTFSAIPSQSAVVQTEKASGLGGLFDNPILLGAMGVGAYFLLTDNKKGGKN